MRKLAFLLALSSALVAGVVTKTTSKSATGVGQDINYEVAVDKAIAQAVSKLSGGYIASSRASSTDLRTHNANSDFRQRFEEKIKSATKGRFSSFEILKEDRSGNLYKITVRVVQTSSKKYYKVPGQNTNKNNLVIVARYNDLDLARFGKAPLVVAHDLKAQLSNEIYKARKFRLLDRDNQAITRAEESYIKNSAAKDEALRLGMSLGADYMLLYDVTRLGYKEGKVGGTGFKSKDTLYMVANVQVILLATKEIKYSTTINFSRQYKNVDDTIYTKFIGEAAAEISNQLHSGIYPPVIEQIVGTEALFTQKLQVGQELDCFARAGVVTDSRTKDKSYAEAFTGVVKVVRNNEKQSYATVLSGKVKKSDICRMKANPDGKAGEPERTGNFVPKTFGGGFKL